MKKTAAMPLPAPPETTGESTLIPPADLQLKMIIEIPITVMREHERVRVVTGGLYSTWRGLDGSTWVKRTIGKQVSWERMYKSPGEPMDPAPQGEFP